MFFYNSLNKYVVWNKIGSEEKKLCWKYNFEIKRREKKRIEFNKFENDVQSKAIIIVIESSW